MSVSVDQASAAAAEAARRKASLEKPRFPLVFKIFLLTAIVIVLVVGIAVGVTVQRANSIAHETVNTSISSAAKLFTELERQRLGRLQLAAQIVAGDPKFASYIQEALMPQSAAEAAPAPAVPGAAPPATAAPAEGEGEQRGPDLLSILDQLTERRDSFGSDLVILLDDQGRVLARTDQPAVASGGAEDLYEQSPLVKKIVEDASTESAVGVLVTGNKLYHAAVVPVGAGATNVRFAYLVNAYAIDDTFANRIAESTNAGVMFAGAAGSTVARSTNAPSVNMAQMETASSIFKTGQPMPPSEVEIDNGAYVMTGQPLLSDKKTVGAAVFLRSLDRELMPFRQIENAMFAGGGIALLVAFLFSWVIAKRITHPIEELAVVAQAVTGGDYSVKPPMDRSDEVGILGRAFAKMITSLRDKAELEELYDQMANRSEAREAALPQYLQPTTEEGTILVSDLRGFSGDTSDASGVIGAIAKAMRIQEAEVARQDGIVREIDGQRLIAVFRGERSVIHAIRASRAIYEELGTQLASVPFGVGIGIATGQFVTGSVAFGEESGFAIVGNAPLIALVCAAQAPSGAAFISWETAQAAGGDVLTTATREEVKLRWLAQPVPVAALQLASMNTGMMRSIGSASNAATMRIDSTVPAETQPSAGGVELSVGQTFAGRYRIDQVLGRGGMGIVYRANDTQLDEIVAIKTLPADMMQKSSEHLERFKREIRLARKITHRNVLRTYDYGEADGVVFISMEYVRGYTLSELIAESDDRRMPPRVTIGISRQICRGLEVAHEQGIIHRDIKPQNVLIDHKGEVKLMDFGIARMAESNEGMTQAGLIVGTPHYMSPEQVQGKTLDPRSDVYSMGVMLYELLTGVKPIDASVLTGVLAAHITEKPKPAIERRPEIGKEINKIVMKCLEKAPEKRYANAGELLHDLDSVQTQQIVAA